jgi:hypothetical protein
MPRTEIIEVGDGVLQAWMYACLDGPEHDPEDRASGGTWLPEVKRRAEAFGFPLFLRNDFHSGKHSWLSTSYVPDLGSLEQHLFSLMEEIEVQTVWGLPSRAVVLRELLQPWPGFVAFEGLPIGKERRWFVRGGEVECQHFYWPAEAIEDRTDYAGWREALGVLNELAEEEFQLQKGYSELLGSILGGYWSLDFYCDAGGKWWFIDAAEGEKSWHPDCEKGPRGAGA